MELIWTILIGLIAGKLAKMLIPGSAPSMLFRTITLGIAGSVVASHGGPYIGIYSVGQPASLVAAAISALASALIGALIGTSTLPPTQHFSARK